MEQFSISSIGTGAAFVPGAEPFHDTELHEDNRVFVVLIVPVIRR